VGRKHAPDWETAASVVNDGFYNCYSDRDAVLRWLYQGANLGLSRPAGLGPVVAGAINIDCSDLVGGHTRWKPRLAQILQRLDGGA